jgi:hypothetical protein
MNDFENELKKQRLRAVPEHWRAQILRAASADMLKHEHQPDTLKREHQPWWMALLWPSPKAWGTMAVVWVAMVCLHIASKGPAEPARRPEAVQIQMAVEEKRRLQAEIEEAAVRLDMESPKPRSEATHWGKPA